MRYATLRAQHPSGCKTPDRWCPGRDLNPHSIREWKGGLSPPRLPVSPPGRLHGRLRHRVTTRARSSWAAMTCQSSLRTRSASGGTSSLATTTPSIMSASTASRGRPFTRIDTTGSAPAAPPARTGRRRMLRSTPTRRGGQRKLGATSDRCAAARVAPGRRVRIRRSRRTPCLHHDGGVLQSSRSCWCPRRRRPACEAAATRRTDGSAGGRLGDRGRLGHRTRAEVDDHLGDADARHGRHLRRRAGSRSRRVRIPGRARRSRLPRGTARRSRSWSAGPVWHRPRRGRRSSRGR